MTNIPNLLSLSRLALLPIIIYFLLMEDVWGPNAMYLAAFFFLIAAITDYFDGKLARKWNQVTEFGTFLDPISDKIFVLCLLLVFAATHRIYGLLLTPALIIIAREILVSGLREYLGPKNIQMPVTTLAKWKTTSQMLACGLLIIAPYFAYGLMVGQWALIISSVITLITGWGYMKAGLDHMKKMA